jgi:hypothetical protein
MMTKNQIVQDCRTAVSYQNGVVAQIRAEAKKEQHADWQARGGCEKCGGRGWIVTWDTMDSMSGCYAEYGSCPEAMCSEDSRALTGLDPSYYSKYDDRRRVKDPFVEPPAVAPELSLLADLKEILDMAAADARVEKNKTIRVVKGRKVAVGTTGQCIWIGSAGGRRGISFGDRVGLKDSSGAVHWTSLSNVEVV